MAGLVFGLAAGFSSGLGQEPSTVVSPRTILRDDMVHGLAVGLVHGLTDALAGGLAFGLPAARRYGVFLLCSRRRLPLRLARFLDWAGTAGLLRCSGPAYQFRHRELQQWLTQHPHP
ncbi:hypothetical protein [Streptomyces sp. HUAS ZL42]|uniref:hypothetical protein n=1 Tax=Streptomyces sp. HUAS ZL42 TaxID=3231715 RepID=UPI00345E8980